VVTWASRAGIKQISLPVAQIREMMQICTTRLTQGKMGIYRCHIETIINIQPLRTNIFCFVQLHPEGKAIQDSHEVNVLLTLFLFQKVSFQMLLNDKNVRPCRYLSIFQNLICSYFCQLSARHFGPLVDTPCRF
jgi:hypothetical protein